MTYYGFSYGTYIGQVWATLHPSSLKAMVLDGVVNPGRVWYQANLDQDHAFGIVFKKFFKWIAKYDRSLHLGHTGRQVGKRIAKLHKHLARKPVRGKFGAAELEDVLTTAGYTNQAWPTIADALSDLANRGSAGALLQMSRPAKGPKADNGYAMYLATSCTDAPWPKDWNVWAADNSRGRPRLAVPRLGERLVQRALPHLAGHQQRHAVRGERRRVHRAGPDHERDVRRRDAVLRRRGRPGAVPDREPDRGQARHHPRGVALGSLLRGRRRRGAAQEGQAPDPQGGRRPGQEVPRPPGAAARLVPGGPVRAGLPASWCRGCRSAEPAPTG